MSYENEFQRQVGILLQKDYPTLAGLSKKEFIDKLTPLSQLVHHYDLPLVDIENGTLPFAIVIKSTLVPNERAMEQVLKDGKEGITKLFPHIPENFHTISDVTVPASDAYLLLDIDRGKKNINIPPSTAMIEIKNAGRFPLTIDEGIALVTLFPEFLVKNNCFSLLGSRVPGNKRVPAIWINGKKHPNLGWCWDGNPHTWLGSASCKKRID